MARVDRLICPGAHLEDGGRGVRFEVAPLTTGFAVRHQGKVHAYVNRCPHMGTELDWQPGEFFGAAPATGTESADSGLYLVCSTHGALFEPGTGICVAGPCRGASLEPLQVREREGQVFVQERAGPTIDSTKNP